MDNKLPDQMFEFDDMNFKPAAKKKPNFVLPIIIIVGGLIVFGALFGAVMFFSKRESAPTRIDGSMTGISVEDQNKRQLTSFVEQFLLSYYCYSAGDVYDQAVKRAETMMTPAFQAAYNQRAEDLDFKRKLTELRVSTDAISILPGSVEIGNQGNHYFIQLAGTMTFTTGINGVSGEFPLNLLMAVDKTSDGFLVDNVERIR